MIDIPRKRTGIVAAGALFAVCALALAPRLAQARGIVPKGTPYAAVVSATVTGETYVEVHTQDVTDNVCEDQSAVSTYNGSVDIHWSASYPSITVPVADAKDLGKAYGRLHLNLKPFVGPGKAGQFTGHFDISGSEPATTYGRRQRLQARPVLRQRRVHAVPEAAEPHPLPRAAPARRPDGVRAADGERLPC